MFKIKNIRLKKILIVEDEKEILELLTDDLTESFHVVTASNGLEAITKFNNQEFNLIIMDFTLPRLNADSVLLEFTKIIQIKKETFPKIIILTGDKDKAVQKLKDFQNAIILEKPFPLEKLKKLCLNLTK